MWLISGTRGVWNCLPAASKRRKKLIGCPSQTELRQRGQIPREFEPAIWRLVPAPLVETDLNEETSQRCKPERRARREHACGGLDFQVEVHPQEIATQVGEVAQLVYWHSNSAKIGKAVPVPRRDDGFEKVERRICDLEGEGSAVELVLFKSSSDAVMSNIIAEQKVLGSYLANNGLNGRRETLFHYQTGKVIP